MNLAQSNCKVQLLSKVQEVKCRPQYPNSACTHCSVQSPPSLIAIEVSGDFYLCRFQITAARPDFSRSRRLRYS